MQLDEYARLDATGLAGLIRSGSLSATEAVQLALDAADRVNPELNAIIHPRYERALEEARSAGGNDGAPFAGVPIVLKDLGAPMAGEPYYAGTAFLREMNYVPAADSYLTARLRRAGFMVIGRTNCPEMGTNITTEPLTYGPTHNPWSSAHSPGGSSGGSAAAVSAGIVPVAHGNDGGGSIRIPASCCGLVGLKPSRGRVSAGPASGDAWAGSAIDNSLARSVRDAAAMLDVLAGYEPGDPYTAPLPSRPFSSEVGAPAGRLHIGFLDHPALREFAADPDCSAAVLSAARILEGLGHVVEEAHPAAMEREGFQQHFLTVVTGSIAAEIDRWSEVFGYRIEPEVLEPDNATFYRMGTEVTASQYLRAVQWLHDYRIRMAEFWHGEGFDILLTPTIAKPPPQLGYLSDPEYGQARIPEYQQFTAQFNVTGQPAVSLPMALSSAGLPIGVQLVAAFGREDLLIRLASQLETAGAFVSQRPRIFAGASL